MDKKTKIFLIGLAIIAFVLRWYLMPDQLFFGPEQGRDFLAIRDIAVNHKLTLIGSKTDIDGVFHGPIFYYLASVPFALSQGNPLGVSAFFIFIQSITVFLAYLLAYELTKSRRAGLIAATLFAVSYLLIVYARWLSNPPLSIPLSLLFILSLLRFVRGRPWYLVAAAFVYGMIGQAEFINYLLFAVIGVITCFMYRKTVVRTRPLILAAAAAVGVLTSLITYVAFDLRHEFLVSNAVAGLLMGKTGYRLDFFGSIAGAFKMLWEQASAILGFSGRTAGFMLIVGIAFVLIRATKKNPDHRILAVWIFAPPVVFSLLRHAMLEQLYAGVIAGLLIGLSLLIESIMRWNARLGRVLLLLSIVMSLSVVYRNLPINRNVFFQGPQPAVRYSDQLAAIDWVYERAQGRPFSFQAYTIPYFWQDAWTYLLGYYGNKKYGYLPDDQGRKLMYVVIQRDTLDPGFQKKWYEETVSKWGTRTSQETIGEYRVEELAVGL